MITKPTFVTVIYSQPTEEQGTPCQNHLLNFYCHKKRKVRPLKYVSFELMTSDKISNLSQC